MTSVCRFLRSPSSSDELPRSQFVAVRSSSLNDTFERVFQRLDPCALQRCLLAWLRGLADKLGAKQFAIDGKALRGAGKEEKGLAILHSVSTWATDVNLTLGQIGLCYSESMVKGETSSEVRLFIGSKKEGAKFYGDGLRNHWGIEDGCHWQLDVTFGDDDSRIRQRNVGLNMALLRRVALSLLKQHPGKTRNATNRYEAALDLKMI